jgi:ArsR family transcriptional regulator
MKSASLDTQLSLLAALGDATRLRLCAVLGHVELSVAELTSVLELGQSKVSTHLARLKDQGLVLDRRVGTSGYYRLNQEGMSEPSQRVWDALRATLSDAILERDHKRALQVLSQRHARSWPERVAGELGRHYSPGRTWESLARCFAGLADLGRVLDIGAGDGTIAEMLAPHARTYDLVDVSPTLLSAARARLAPVGGDCALIRADMHALPFRSERFALVLSLHALTYSGEPRKALDEAVRMVQPGGRLVVMTLGKHDHMDVAGDYGHVQPGFSPRWLKRALTERGMRVSRCGVVAREHKRPHFEVLTCFAQKA